MKKASNVHGIDKGFWPTLAALIVVFILFEATHLDLIVQDYFYDFHNHAWIVNAKSAIPRMIFYNGPKVAIIITAVVMLLLCLLRSDDRYRILKTVIRRCDLIVLLTTLALAPALIAACKAKSNVFCPYQITRYGGEQPYVRVLESYPEGHDFSKKGKGFPAGHASGGFALMSLVGLATSRRGRVMGMAIGLFLGSAMGLYQMAKGAHYLSHTMITALFCWWIFLLMRKVFLPRATPPLKQDEH